MGTHFRLLVLLCSALSVVGLFGQQTLVGTANDGERDYIFDFDPATGTVDTLALILSNQDPTNQFNGGTGSLVKAPNGVVYGLAPSGGRYMRGSLYRVDSIAGTRITLYEFADTLFGKAPNDHLFLTPQNTLVGFTTRGGIHGNGTVIEFDPATNSVSKLLDFGPGQVNTSSRAMLRHQNGKIYIAGAGPNYDAVYTYDHVNNQFNLLLQFPSTTGPVRDMIELPDGRLVYGLTTFVGLGSYIGTFQPDGTGFTMDISVPPGGDGLPRRLIYIPGTGEIYATTEPPDDVHGIIRLDLAAQTATIVHQYVNPPNSLSMSRPVLVDSSTFVGIVEQAGGWGREFYAYQAGLGQYTTLTSISTEGYFLNQPTLFADHLWFISQRTIAGDWDDYMDWYVEDVLSFNVQTTTVDTLASSENTGCYCFSYDIIHRTKDGNGLFVCSPGEYAVEVNLCSIDPETSELDTLFMISGGTHCWAHNLSDDDSLWIALIPNLAFTEQVLLSVNMYDLTIDTLAVVPLGPQYSRLYVHGDSVILVAQGVGQLGVIDMTTGVHTVVHDFSTAMQLPQELLRASDGWYYGITEGLVDSAMLFRYNPETATVEELVGETAWVGFGWELTERVNDNGEPVIVGSSRYNQGGFLWNMAVDTMAFFTVDPFQCTDNYWSRQHAIGLDKRWYGYIMSDVDPWTSMDTISIYSYDPFSLLAECHGIISTNYNAGPELVWLYPDSAVVGPEHVLEVPGLAPQISVRYDELGQHVVWDWTTTRGPARLSLYDVAGRMIWTSSVHNTGRFMLPGELEWPGVAIARLEIAGKAIGAAKVVDITRGGL